MDNNPLGCTCQLVDQLNAVKDAVIGGECEFPVAADGITLGISTAADAIYFLNSNHSLFQCSKCSTF